MNVALRGGTDYLETPPDPAVLNQYVRWNRPLVFRGLHEKMSKGNAFDLDFLSEHLRHAKVEIVRSPTRKLRWDPEHRMPYERMPFADFRALHENETFDGPRAYLQDDIGNFPELTRHFEDPPYFEGRAIKRRKLWVSGAGIWVPLHYDPVEQLHWVLQGRKRFLCFRPGVRDYYPYGPFSKAPIISRVDADEPDFDAFPRFANTTAVEIEVRAGELMYVPPFWWHQVQSMDAFNVSINWAWFASAPKALQHARAFGRCLVHLLWQGRRVQAAARAGARG
jgi:hypothetical protein